MGVEGGGYRVSLSLRLKDLLGPVTRVKKKKGYRVLAAHEVDVFKAHRLLVSLNSGLTVIKKKEKAPSARRP